MKYMIKLFFHSLFIITVLLSSYSCKEKDPTINEKLLGTWQIKLAHIYSVYSFRANGSWTSSERVEGKFNKIVENRGKVVGQWEIEESPDEEGVRYLIMTPSVVEVIDGWKVDVTIKFEIMALDKENLKLRMQSGRQVTWKKVRSQSAEENVLDTAGAKVKVWPVVVNLNRTRAHAKFRFLCIDLDLYMDNPGESDFVSLENNQETEEIEYHLHPKIREVIIIYFSSMTYKEAKTLIKIKKAVDNLKIVLNPYFKGKLNEIDVVKVVVTTNAESVKDFELMYKADYEVQE